jgi:aryl-alcohol dehydrogenase-like predicted oxidoreductase
VLQYHTNILEPRDDIYDFVCKHNIGTQVRGVMAQGRLSGKYFHHKPTWRPDDNRSNWFRNDDFTRYSMFEKAVPDGMTMAQVAIRWILDQPGNHSICMGAKNLADYDAAICATEMPPLSEKTKEQLTEITGLLT